MIENPNHNIVACSNLPITLGGGYRVEIFTVTLINQPEGCPTIINRAFVTDTVNNSNLDMISLDLGSGAFNLDEIRTLASEAIAERAKRDRGLGRLLDAIDGISPTEEI